MSKEEEIAIEELEKFESYAIDNSQHPHAQMFSHRQMIDMFIEGCRYSNKTKENGKMNKLFESMTKIELQNMTIRIWRQEEKDSDNYDNSDIIRKAHEMGSHSLIMTAEILLEQPRVNAVEVLDLEGNGIVAYNDWP